MGKLQVSGNIAELNAAWVQYLERIDPNDRAVLADHLADADVSSIAGINDLCLRMIVAQVRGRMSPVVAEGVKRWVELISMNIHMMNSLAGTPAQTGPDMHAIMSEAVQRLKPVNGRFVRVVKEEAPDIIDAANSLVELPDSQKQKRGR